MSLTHYKISIIVTGVTGLLRVKSTPRNTVKALPHLHYRHPVTAVTGLCTRAHGRKISIRFYLFNSMSIEYFPARGDLPRNTRNIRNNHCFY